MINYTMQFTVVQVFKDVYYTFSLSARDQARREPARAPGQTTFRAPPHPLPFHLPSLPPPSHPPLLFLPSHPIPLFSPTPFPPFPSLPSLPLEVGPLNPGRGSGGAL